MRPTPLDPRDEEHFESPDQDRRPTRADRRPAPHRHYANRAMLGALAVLLVVIVLIALL
jgi:hypothetical protein